MTNFHHTWHPYRRTPTSLVVAGESEWQKPLELDRHAQDYPRQCRHCGGRIAPDRPNQIILGCFACGCTDLPFVRPAVLLAPDLCEEWSGRVRNERLEPLIKSIVTTGLWVKDPELYGSDVGTVTMADVIARVFSVIDRTPNLDYYASTAFPERIGEVAPQGKIANDGEDECPTWKPHIRPNIRWGLRASTQAALDAGVPQLLRQPAAGYWFDLEPGEAIDLNALKPKAVPNWWQGDLNPLSRISLVRVRTDREEFARPILEQCAAAGVACAWEMP